MSFLGVWPAVSPPYVAVRPPYVPGRPVRIRLWVQTGPPGHTGLPGLYGIAVPAPVGVYGAPPPAAPPAPAVALGGIHSTNRAAAISTRLLPGLILLLVWPTL